MYGRPVGGVVALFWGFVHGYSAFALRDGSGVATLIRGGVVGFYLYHSSASDAILMNDILT